MIRFLVVDGFVVGNAISKIFEHADFRVYRTTTASRAAGKMPECLAQSGIPEMPNIVTIGPTLEQLSPKTKVQRCDHVRRIDRFLFADQTTGSLNKAADHVRGCPFEL